MPHGLIIKRFSVSWRTPTRNGDQFVGERLSVIGEGAARGRVLYPDTVAGASPEEGPCGRARRRG